MGGDERWVCLDVGETLIDETRFWALWADTLRVSRLTFGAALGAVIQQGRDHRDTFELLGVTDYWALSEPIETAFGGLRAEDLYSDALSAVAELQSAGFKVDVTANQPAHRAGELRALGFQLEVLAMSDAIGVSKPDPAFFAKTLGLMGDPVPSAVAYVGDRIDNDVIPARNAGMRAVWLRRGPWGRIQHDETRAACLIVDSLTELVARIDEARDGETEPSG